jgi:hypothetical protein
MGEEMINFDWLGPFVLPFVFFMLICGGIGWFIGAVVFADSGVEIIQKQAIENNCAQYNPTSGNFEWVKK